MTSTPSHTTDVIIIGAGAAGLMCAITAGRRGRRVCVLDHARHPAEKIRISGGGRCNFTNIHTTPANFLSNNPRFCVSALARYTPFDFIDLVRRHGIAYHEKTLGQLFCDDSAQQIIRMLLDECAGAGAEIRLSTAVTGISHNDAGFAVSTPHGVLRAPSLVVACGGPSIPKMGATGFGYDIARQFGLNVITPRPALVPFTLSPPDMAHVAELSGVSVYAQAHTGAQMFEEGVLFTHRGLSGPAILQISSYWQPGTPITLDLAPTQHMGDALCRAKHDHPRQDIATQLSHHLPKRLALAWLAQAGADLGARRMADIPNQQLLALGAAINRWTCIPAGTEGYAKAEVTAGGVDTDTLSSKTMHSKTVPGLYFIGEVVDVTGHLGGFNFQWAWASGYAAGQYA